MWLRPALALAISVTASAASQPAAPAPSAVRELSREDRAVFLERARIVRERRVSKGITGTVRVTLTDGTFTHDASVQTIDERKPIFAGKRGTEVDFRDTWRYNLAAYHLDVLLDLRMVPTTVHRRFKGNDASFTWWVDEVLMDEGERVKQKVAAPDQTAWSHQVWTMRVFDQLIDNTDRNLGNMLIDRGWKVWLIDHTRAFRRGPELRTPGILTRCDRALLAALQALDGGRVKAAVGKWLADREIAPLLARRDRIVEHFERAGPGAIYDATPPRHP